MHSGNSKSYQAVLDSGIPFIVVPEAMFEVISDELQSQIGSNGVTCAFGFCLIDRECSSFEEQMEPMFFSFDDIWQFSIPPENYLYNAAELGYPGQCVLAVIGWTTDSNDYIVLGDNFLQNFY